ncbi:MAG: magnesium transporter [Puniceicoccaceae bacterium]|nr:MAG: magnesium transporter [Puniceicoccaceae bacterium]
MTRNLANEIIHEMLAKKNFGELRDVLARVSPELLPPLFDTLGKSDRVLLFRSLPRDKAADAFSFLDDAHQRSLLADLTDKETADLLANLSPDDRTFLLEELPAAATQKLLGLLDQDDRKVALTLLGYPEDSVGRLMSPDFASVRQEMTVQEAMRHIKAHAQDSETLNMIYVTDDQGRLIDDVRLRRFIAAPDDAKVSDLLDGRFVSLQAAQHREAAVRLMKQTGYFALPVCDRDGVLLGIVTADDVLDVAVEEATEDIHKGGAIKPLETPLLATPVTALYARRIVWLVLLVFVNIFSGAGIAAYEELIESVVALVFFLPLLIDSGGNAGSQASTLVIRAMALGEVKMKHYLFAVFRELRVAFLLGLSMAVAVFAVAYFRSGIEVAQVVAISMVAIVIIGSVIGMSLPFILKKLKLDPATASAPLVTSIADISGVLIYLAIASALLGGLAE